MPMCHCAKDFTPMASWSVLKTESFCGLVPNDVSTNLKLSYLGSRCTKASVNLWQQQFIYSDMPNSVQETWFYTVHHVCTIEANLADVYDSPEKLRLWHQSACISFLQLRDSNQPSNKFIPSNPATEYYELTKFAESVLSSASSNSLMYSLADFSTCR